MPAGVAAPVLEPASRGGDPGVQAIREQVQSIEEQPVECVFRQCPEEVKTGAKLVERGRGRVIGRGQLMQRAPLQAG
jgi:hypothetical protein